MSYQVTCICGYRFTVSPDNVGKHIACPECHRALIPLPAEAPASQGATVSAVALPAVNPVAAAAGAGQPMKACPFCGEQILEVAKKCRFCNEFLDAANPPSVKTAAPRSPPVFMLSVSQWDNFFKYVVCLAIAVGMGFLLYGFPSVNPIPNNLQPETKGFILLGTLVLMGLIAFVFFVGTRSARCRIWPTRIETQVGFIAKQMDSLEVSRITDLEIKQGILARILGVGTIIIRTTDVNTPMMELYQIPRARRVYRFLQDHIQAAGNPQNTGR